MNVRVVYFWDSGTYVNTFHAEFDQAYRELCNEYGPPQCALTRDDSDWDTGRKSKGD